MQWHISSKNFYLCLLEYFYSHCKFYGPQAPFYLATLAGIPSYPVFAKDLQTDHIHIPCYHSLQGLAASDGCYLRFHGAT